MAGNGKQGFKATYQRTLKNTVNASGVGLHSGLKVDLTLSPATVNTGIVFRYDIGSRVICIAATAQNIVSTELATTIGDGQGTTIATIEHLMAAFAGLGIDNCFVNLSAGEVPIMDGSAAPFAFLIRSAGIWEQAITKRFIRITKPVCVKEDDKWVRYDPFDGCRFTCEINFTRYGTGIWYMLRCLDRRKICRFMSVIMHLNNAVLQRQSVRLGSWRVLLILPHATG